MKPPVTVLVPAKASKMPSPVSYVPRSKLSRVVGTFEKVLVSWPMPPVAMRMAMLPCRVSVPEVVK